MTSSVGTPLSSPDMVRDSPDRARSRRRQSDGNAARNRLRRRVSFKLHLDLAALFRRIRATSGKPQSAQTADRVWLGEKEALRGSAQAFHTLGPEATYLATVFWRAVEPPHSSSLRQAQSTGRTTISRPTCNEPPSLSARRRVRQGSFAAPGRGIHVGSRARARGCTKSGSPPLFSRESLRATYPERVGMRRFQTRIW